jgi:hypothetical protein
MTMFNLLLSALVLATAANAFEVLPVSLGTAGEFVILAKSGISTVPASVIVGDIGVSPIASLALTGFSLTMDPSGTFSTSDQITGKAYAAEYTSPTPSEMTAAILDMETAYGDAASRPTSSAKHLNFEAGLLTGMTLEPGVYTWGTSISFEDKLYITGNSTDRWIFQTTGNVVVGNAAEVILQGGALASNIVWQLAGFLTAGTTSKLKGTFLIATKAVFNTGSSLNGRVYAQTAVTLDTTTITEPQA